MTMMTQEKALVKGNAFKPTGVCNLVSDLMGKILTIVEATNDGEKRDAVKSLVRREFSDKFDLIWKMAYKKESSEQSGKELRSVWEDDLVPVEDLQKNYSFD